VVTHRVTIEATLRSAKKQTHRTTTAAYVSAERHLRGGSRGAKTLTQMAKEIGTTKSTVRRWLRRNHWHLWMEHWASVEDIWEAARQDREQRPDRRAKELTEVQARKELLAGLDGSLAELTSDGPARWHDLRP
jgi:IS30 family transposase